ncbi:unnamed protein product [Albugo candida]|uniref:Importin N-terminal domain-containing protein n=1 Tax=Albugo candida TaxID=65357 RepID=A0A024GL05_9STRA|nr:unnamed protein product [Albugo candida]|eukprot:CCI47572.1 unnamed protein product [Albugo candida]
MQASAGYNPQQLETCILQLTQADTNQIKQAEDALKIYMKSSACIHGLMTQLEHSSYAQVRQYAAILLRKRIFKHWSALDVSMQTNLKQVLLQRAVQESTRIVRFNIIDLVAAIASRELPMQKWPELFSFVTNCAQSTSAELRVIGMYLLRLLAEQAGTFLQTIFLDLKVLFTNALQDQESINVRTAAMRAACSIIEYLEDKDLCEFQSLVPLMISVFEQCLVNGAEQEAAEFLDVFSEVASNPYPILDQSFPTFIEILLQILAHDRFDGTIHSSASFVMSEFISRKPKTIGKMNLVPKIMTTILDVIASDDEVSCGRIPELLQLDAGSKVDNQAEEDQESLGYLAQQMLDTLALNVPAKYLNPVIFGLYQEYITSPDARKRKAATLALAILSEGCSEIMCKNLDNLINSVYQMAQDNDLHVREAACFALGQFAEFLQPDISKYYDRIVPICITLLNDTTKTICALALYVLDEITQIMDSEQMAPYLDSLMTKLVNVSRSSSPGIQKMALDAIGSVALGAKENFLVYFPAIMELMQPFWHISDSRYFFLRGVAVECVGYLATALGKDNFRPYLEPLMPHVIATIQIDDSELKEQAFVYLINVAGIFKEEFGPYLEVAVTHALATLQSSDGIRLLEDEEKNWGASDDEDEDKAHHISIRTDALNSKVRALNAVEAFAANCGALFEQYIPQFLHAVAELVDYVQEDVRAAAVEALAALVLCSFNAAHPGPVDEQVWIRGEVNPNVLTSNNKIVLDAVLKAFVEDALEDPEEIVVSKTFDSLKAILERVGPTAVVNHIDTIMTQVKQVILHQHDCQAVHEEDDGDDMDGEGSSVVTSATELVCQLAQCYGEHFLSSFHAIFPDLLSYATGLRTTSDRASIIGCFAEVLPALGPNSINFVESLFPVLIQGLASDQADLKGNCAFCLGTLAEISGEKLTSAYQQMLQALHPLFTAERNDERVVDNAAAAVARMITTSPTSVPLAPVLPVFLGALPLKSDFEENEAVYKCLNGLVRSKHNDVLQHLGSIMEIYAKSLSPDSSVDEDIQQDIKVCVKELLAAFEPQVKDVVSRMALEHQNVLTTALQ